MTCRTTAGSSRVRSLRAVSDQPYDSRACHCHLALNARACQAYQLPAPHTTRPNSSVTIWTHQVVQPRLAQVWHRIRPDGHKCEAVGGRIWSLALGGAVRTAYGLRLKLTNENPHKKLVSPSPAELTAQGASSAGFTFSFLATICDTRASLASRARPRRLGSRIALSNLPGKPARHH